MAGTVQRVMAVRMIRGFRAIFGEVVLCWREPYRGTWTPLPWYQSIAGARALRLGHHRRRSGLELWVSRLARTSTGRRTIKAVAVVSKVSQLIRDIPVLGHWNSTPAATTADA